MTSSARSMIDGGIARPSAVAVLRFTIISNLVGNCTERSPGFSPRLAYAGVALRRQNPSQKYLKFQLPRAVCGVLQLLRGVSEDGSGPTRLAVRVDERIALDAVVPLPLDGEVGVGLFDVDGLGVAVPCQWCGKPVA